MTTIVCTSYFDTWASSISSSLDDIEEVAGIGLAISGPGFFFHLKHLLITLMLGLIYRMVAFLETI